MKRGNPWDENPFGSRQGGDCGGNPATNTSGSGTCSSEAGHFIPIRILEENLKNQMNDMDMDFDFETKQQPINRIEIPNCFKQAEDDFRCKGPRVKNIPPPLIQTEHVHGGRASSPFLDPGQHHTPIHSPNFNSNGVRHIPITVEGKQKSPAPCTPPQNKRNSSSRNNTPPPVKLDPIPMPAPPTQENSQNKPPSPPPRSPKNKNAHLKFENMIQPTSPSEELKSTRMFPGVNAPVNVHQQNVSSAQAIPIISNTHNSPANNAPQPNFTNANPHSPNFVAPVQSPHFANAHAQPPNFANAHVQPPNFKHVHAPQSNLKNSHAQSPSFNNLAAQTQNFASAKAHSPQFNTVPNKFTFNHVPAPATSPNQANNDESQSVPPPQKKPTPATSQLEKVDAVSQDVKQLEKQITEFTGNSKNKEYLFLDEMLTRNLIKLDNIETEGKEDVRNARKSCIKLIQKCITDLEAKLLANNNPNAALSGKSTDKAGTKATSEPPFQRNEMNIEVNLGEKKDPGPSAVVGDVAGKNKTNAEKGDCNRK
ncbi:unnamed protein product [Allacma fusca]|uniref:BAG domain-containing protein n=1 Tax=Allacma fusca TaxID=39272 RepID=A0A8J2PLH1_9HEXA|nr:unnamed protein product [Allacma fusca]